MMKELLNTIREQVRGPPPRALQLQFLTVDMCVACAVQRSQFLEQAEQVQTDMGKSLKKVRGIRRKTGSVQCGILLCWRNAPCMQLETLQASAAETPELEMRQKELQDQVDGLQSQMEAAVSASKKVHFAFVNNQWFLVPTVCTKT